jgi:hypothetical protein
MFGFTKHPPFAFSGDIHTANREKMFYRRAAEILSANVPNSFAPCLWGEYLLFPLITLCRAMLFAVIRRFELSSATI